MEYYKSVKAFLFLSVCLFVCASFFGCATAPIKDNIALYNINGVTYLPLGVLCQRKKLELRYDAFAKTALISGQNHKINLMVGQNLILVDGYPQHIKHNIELYQGALVVPEKFRTEILEQIFPVTCPIGAQAMPLSIKKIVIDPGHGGYDPGTHGRSGIQEKEINLDIAKRLAGLLNCEGAETVLTRSSDVFVSLQRRAEIANRAKADLFISIHSNANRVRSLNGFEVYYISDSGNNWRNKNSKGGLLPISRSSYQELSPALETTLWDMIYTYQKAQSIGLAESICKSVSGNSCPRVIGTKSAGFYVLKGTQMPAVLVEVGFLSNTQEERLLKNSSYRQEIADAIVSGIKNYANDYRLAEDKK